MRRGVDVVVGTGAVAPAGLEGVAEGVEIRGESDVEDGGPFDSSQAPARRTAPRATYVSVLRCTGRAA